MAELGRFFRERRGQAGLTQKQVAGAVGVSQNTVSKWETAQAQPTGANLTGLLRVLDIDAAEYAAALHDSEIAAAIDRVAAALEHIANRLGPAP